MKTLQGIAAAPGIAIGPVFCLGNSELEIVRRPIQDPDLEWARLREVARRAEIELEELGSQVNCELGPNQAAIFEAQSMILWDPTLMKSVKEGIYGRLLNAEVALDEVIQQYVAQLGQVEDDYIRARATDIRDVGDRLLRLLLGQPSVAASDLKSPAIVVADDLTPSETVLLDRNLVLGFCTARGGTTSHTAILAQGLGLPAVVGVGQSVSEIPHGAHLILDGSTGRLLVDPDKDELERARARQASLAAELETARQQSARPACTADGQDIEVFANIGRVEDAREAVEAGAEGVGLFRTEFLFLDRDNMPDEEEQYAVYRAVLDVFGDRPVILRTLDIGGDKPLPYLHLPAEMNPFLGQRAIRLCLERPEIVRPQLRACLRAGVRGRLKLMFPLVATVAEVKAARALLDECRSELLDEGVSVPERLEIGIMVEVPAAALMIDDLLESVDFVSIGTNDLAQYTLAADRTNASVVGLADAFHPAVLRLVRDVIAAANAAGKEVGLCGELASRPLAVPILLGFGLREFSVAAPQVPTIKQVIRSIPLESARQVAGQVVTLRSAGDVRALVAERFPDLAAM